MQPSRRENALRRPAPLSLQRSNKMSIASILAPSTDSPFSPLTPPSTSFSPPLVERTTPCDSLPGLPAPPPATADSVVSEPASLTRSQATTFPAQTHYLRSQRIPMSPSDSAPSFLEPVPPDSTTNPLRNTASIEARVDSSQANRKDTASPNCHAGLQTGQPALLGHRKLTSPHQNGKRFGSTPDQLPQQTYPAKQHCPQRDTRIPEQRDARHPEHLEALETSKSIEAGGGVQSSVSRSRPSPLPIHPQDSIASMQPYEQPIAHGLRRAPYGTYGFPSRPADASRNGGYSSLVPQPSSPFLERHTETHVENRQRSYVPCRRQDRNSMPSGPERLGPTMPPPFGESYASHMGTEAEPHSDSLSRHFYLRDQGESGKPTQSYLGQQSPHVAGLPRSSEYGAASGHGPNFRSDSELQQSALQFFPRPPLGEHGRLHHSAPMCSGISQPPTQLIPPPQNTRWSHSCAHEPKTKRPWTEREDAQLRELTGRLGVGLWAAIAEHIPGRTGKQVRERWLNHLSPAVVKRPWSPDEDRIIIEAHARYGNSWSKICKLLKGRSENMCKNRFWTKLCKQTANPRASLKQEDRMKLGPQRPLGKR